MLSYMLPATQPPAPAPAGAGARLALELAPRPARTNISKESSTSSFASDLTMSSSTPTGAIDKPKHKLLGNGTKHTSLKRVSFGSSKGSMVETLIYESPLQEEPEGSPPPKLHETAFPYSPAEEDSERSKVRVSFYQGARPQCVSPPLASLPESQVYTPLLVPDMADHGVYNRQISTESGWDNPFRPDGDLSREADEIVSLIKGGKPITPTPTAAPQLAVDETDQLKHTANNLTANGPAAAAGGTANGASPAHVDVQRAPAQQPLQPEHVTIKKKPKCKCCVVQ